VNCVSERVAREMAAGARQRFGAAIGLSTTGYAEPSPSEGIKHPFAYFAIDVDGNVTSGKLEAPGLARVAMQQHITEQVMDKLVMLLGE